MEDSKYKLYIAEGKMPSSGVKNLKWVLSLPHQLLVSLVTTYFVADLWITISCTNLASCQRFNYEWLPPNLLLEPLMTTCFIVILLMVVSVSKPYRNIYFLIGICHPLYQSFQKKTNLFTKSI